MGAVNISIIKGDVQQITCIIYENGVVKNLTDYSAKMYIADKKDEATDETIEGTIDDAAFGVVLFTITNTISKGWTLAIYFYEMKIFKADLTDVKTFQTGEINVIKAINPDVT